MIGKDQLNELEDLICVDLRNLLESQFGEVEYIGEVKAVACRIVCDRIYEMNIKHLEFNDGEDDES